MDKTNTYQPISAKFSNYCWFGCVIIWYVLGVYFVVELHMTANVKSNISIEWKEMELQLCMCMWMVNLRKLHSYLYCIVSPHKFPLIWYIHTNTHTHTYPHTMSYCTFIQQYLSIQSDWIWTSKRDKECLIQEYWYFARLVWMQFQLKRNSNCTITMLTNFKECFCENLSIKMRTISVLFFYLYINLNFYSTSSDSC